MKKEFYNLLANYLSLYIRPQNSVIEIDPSTDLLIKHFPKGRSISRTTSSADGNAIDLAAAQEESPDYVLLNGLVHYERDIQGLFRSVRKHCSDDTRLVIVYYSSLWKPLMTLASRLGLRTKMPELNWLAHADIDNLLTLEDFELIRRDNKVLMPVSIPLVSRFVNRYLAPLPFFRLFSMVNIVVARPQTICRAPGHLSVSVVVPARNEAGNIERIIERVPKMGPDDELIFIEGGSTDNTWEKITEVNDKYGHDRNIVIDRQDGKGKGDAVRKGFRLAGKDILMILDADMTVPPEDLTKFYNAIISGKGEFINGSRLVYPMEKKAMRFFNLLGNKFFATAFSFVLGQRLKDTLCGTKVLSRHHYEVLAQNRSYFGEFDPFGDFDLIFGASRMCLKIIEVPIVYRERTYGETNISRWRHGAILLRMLLFAARKIKFI